MKNLKQSTTRILSLINKAKELQKNNTEILDLKRRMLEKETQWEEERSSWRREKEDMSNRINNLEGIVENQEKVRRKNK